MKNYWGGKPHQMPGRLVLGWFFSAVWCRWFFLFGGLLGQATKSINYDSVPKDRMKLEQPTNSIYEFVQKWWFPPFPRPTIVNPTFKETMNLYPISAAPCHTKAQSLRQVHRAVPWAWAAVRSAVRSIPQVGVRENRAEEWCADA